MKTCACRPSGGEYPDRLRSVHHQAEDLRVPRGKYPQQRADRGKFQLTPALDRLRREDGFLGLMIDGQPYDIGLPEYYLDTLAKFSR